MVRAFRFACLPIAIAVAILVALPRTAWGAAASAGPPSQLDATWNEMMLSGSFGWINDGKSQRSGYTRNSGKGWIHEASLSSIGIDVMDLRERRFLKSNGGWSLQADSAWWRSARNRSSSICKAVAVGLDGRTFNQKVVWGGWGPAHEFFLLARVDRAGQSLVLRRWTLPFDGPGRFFVRGFLDYDEAARVASVRITDEFKTVIDERISLGNCWRE